MDLTHRFRVPAGIDATWNAFNDIEALAPCFPGATITDFDGSTFTGSIKIKLGPVALVYAGSGRYVERDAKGHRLVLEARGDDRRGNGDAVVRVTVTLVDEGEQTAAEVGTALELTGRPAQFGSGVVSDVSDRLLDQFESCLSPRFAEGLGVAAEPGPDDEPDYDAAAERTVELGAVPEEVDGISLGSSAGVPSAAGPSSATPPAWTPPGRSTPPGYTPPSNLAQPDFNVFATVVPVVVKRYWPALAAVGVAAFVAAKVLGRKR